MALDFKSAERPPKDPSPLQVRIANPAVPIAPASPGTAGPPWPSWLQRSWQTGRTVPTALLPLQAHIANPAVPAPSAGRRLRAPVTLRIPPPSIHHPSTFGNFANSRCTSWGFSREASRISQPVAWQYAQSVDPVRPSPEQDGHGKAMRTSVKVRGFSMRSRRGASPGPAAECNRCLAKGGSKAFHELHIVTTTSATSPSTQDSYSPGNPGSEGGIGSG